MSEPQPARRADPSSPADRAASFERGAALYAGVRPAYPVACVDWLLPAGAERVLDLAAGTGLLTTSLAARGLDVVAVEPSAAMLTELRERLPGVTTHLGTAEAIPLPGRCVDAVLVGQAWHWFEPSRAAAEVARVLRPGGQVGVTWNDRDERAGWVARFGEILHRGDRLDPRTAHDHASPALGPAFTEVEHASFPWSDRVRTTDLRMLAASRSYLLTLPDDARDALLDAVDHLVLTHPDLAGRSVVDLPYVARAFRARLR
ncbi:class I SAM-dependent methyltransferase [Cellulomonas sp. PhB143]|uniref:class I SAM-dependent methyltransferase n=1 Tax=Cellulomonas sp. PhB143 TaxID=2485186 RepID=UPI000F48D651|nr:class I SAM-dependent methyltransferase [Cellulomonas sp. PhB143]ROS74493.1 methyltransferase family protein [Cellulomonas sp. PhB143]